MSKKRQIRTTKFLGTSLNEKIFKLIVGYCEEKNITRSSLITEWAEKFFRKELKELKKAEGK